MQVGGPAAAAGREIVFVTASGDVAAVDVTVGPGFRAGAPQVLVRNLGTEARYAVATPDHSRFLVRVPPEDSSARASEIRLLFGWAKALKAGRLGASSR